MDWNCCDALNFEQSKILEFIQNMKNHFDGTFLSNSSNELKNAQQQMNEKYQEISTQIQEFENQIKNLENQLGWSIKFLSKKFF